MAAKTEAPVARTLSDADIIASLADLCSCVRAVGYLIRREIHRSSVSDELDAHIGRKTRAVEERLGLAK